nr:ImmA/IrrE family metallo-endopeptidase [Salinivirgaceae bacterium]
MSNDIRIEIELLSPPGDTIQETLETIGMSQAELAERMAYPKEKLNDLIKGREPLTRKNALKLERILGIPLSFWMNRENEYREELMRIEELEKAERNKEWLKAFPLREMKKMEVVSDTKDLKVLYTEVLTFFSVGSPKAWERIYLNEEVSAAFKISLAHTQSPHALSVWLRIGELKSKEMNLPSYDENLFKKLLGDVKLIVKEQPDNFAQQLQNKCAFAGVAVLYTQGLPKAPISGATWWKGGNPIIQLSGRYKTNDQFWFTFFHEAAHILKHGKRAVFLENVKGTPNDTEKEKEADQFAQK